ncbi:MAG: asparaginase [Actinomycetota bacterium]
MRAEPLVRVVRSGVEESVHLGHVAVCDADGRLIASAGDPGQIVFARSCMKPLQTAVSLAAIGDLRLSDREIAVMSASHNAEPIHLGAVRALLKRSGLGPSALRTPPAWPLDEQEMARAHHPNPQFHDCSGKHAGMLLACVRAGWDPSTYPQRSHPLQRRVLRAVQRGTSADIVATGVDGCGIPVHAVPLAAMATLYARLADAERMAPLAEQTDRAVEAMLTEPYLVGGRDRDDTALMQATGDVMAKEGAEALDCAVSLSSGLGVAVKIADGGSRAVGPALLHALAQLDVLDARQLAVLAGRLRPPVLGGGAPVGVLEPAFTLRRR